MRKKIAGLVVDKVPPEKMKFKAPLVFIHGLWSSSRSWRPWANHFSNLGWDCWMANLPGRAEESSDRTLERLTFRGCLEDLNKLIAAAPFPPVLIGHDLGGLLAQKAAEEEKISALILVASLPPKGMQAVLPQPVRLLRLKYWPLVFLGRPFSLQEKDFYRIWLSSLPEDQHGEVLESMVPDSTHLVKEFFGRQVNVDFDAIRCPVLVVAASEDQVVPVTSLREMAQKLGTDFREYSGHGHWIIGEEGGQAIVRDIHRWIVQKLGDEILLAEFSNQKEWFE
jgi:pimeloyl-ACP methyl ester carboxylesterase